MKTAVIVAMVLALAGCSRKTEKAGIGRYHVNKLTLAKATGRCDPTDLPDGRKGTWCYAQPKLGIAGMNADVDLYFAGSEPTSPVIEIQFQIAGCKDEKLLTWLKTNFGAPAEDRGTKAFWETPAMYMVAELGARCMVRLLPKSEQAEYARLQKQP